MSHQLWTHSTLLLFLFSLLLLVACAPTTSPSGPVPDISVPIPAQNVSVGLPTDDNGSLLPNASANPLPVTPSPVTLSPVTFTLQIGDQYREGRIDLGLVALDVNSASLSLQDDGSSRNVTLGVNETVLLAGRELRLDAIGGGPERDAAEISIAAGTGAVRTIIAQDTRRSLSSGNVTFNVTLLFVNNAATRSALFLVDGEEFSLDEGDDRPIRGGWLFLRHIYPAKDRVVPLNATFVLFPSKSDVTGAGTASSSNS